MTIIRQWLYFGALIIVCALALWVMSIRLDAATAAVDLQREKTSQASQRAESLASDLDSMAERLHNEQRAQAAMAAEQQGLQLALRERQQHIEELTRENQQLHAWADLPLPDAARRLRWRPAITGADGFREWLSRRDALPAAGSQPDQ